MQYIVLYCSIIWTFKKKVGIDTNFNTGVKSSQCSSQVRHFRTTAPVRAPDYYETLGVARGATKEEIKKAFYQVIIQQHAIYYIQTFMVFSCFSIITCLPFEQSAKKYHPDANKSDPNAQKKFAECSQAYEVLQLTLFFLCRFVWNEIEYVCIGSYIF